MLRLLLQPPRILCTCTVNYPHLPGNLCSLPLTGSHDSGTTSPGEHMAHLRLLQCHTSLCHHRLTPHSVPLIPLDWVSQSSLISCSFNAVLSGQGTDALRWPKRRGGVKSKAEPQELCEQRREREISPCSLRSSGLNLHNQLDVPASVEYLNRQWSNPKLRQWILGATVDLGFVVCSWLVSDFYIYLSKVFITCYHWWIWLLVWLLSSFYFNNIFYFNYFIFLSFFFFLIFILSQVADRVLVPQLGARPEPLRWESQVQDIEPPDTSSYCIISISKSSLRDLCLNGKTHLHSTTNKLQCWTPHAKQLARQEHNHTC